MLASAADNNRVERIIPNNILNECATFNIAGPATKL